jgi:hypothetical protein
LISRFVICAFGYVCAALSAHFAKWPVAALNDFFEIWPLDHNPDRNNLVYVLLWAIVMLPGYFVLFMPCIAAVFIAEVMSWRSWYFFVISFTALPLPYYAVKYSNWHSYDKQLLVDVTLIAYLGAVAGLVYWLIAGKRAGSWRAKAQI